MIIDKITTEEQVRAMPEAQGLSAGQLERLVAMAVNAEVEVEIGDALDLTRNTVVAAVDGSRGRPEGNFVAAAWRLRFNVSAYDPEMKLAALRPMLTDLHVPDDTSVLLSKQSVTTFGVHVPHTDVFVPHPGPWVTASPNDLASCLDQVLGANSKAFVLTDNEPSSKYADSLQQRISAINQTNTHTAGYRQLTVQVSVAQTELRDGHSYTKLGDVDFELGHQPNYRLVQVTRN